MPWRTELAMIDSQGPLGLRCPMNVPERRSDSVILRMVAQCYERIARSAATTTPPMVWVLGTEGSNELLVR